MGKQQKRGRLKIFLGYAAGVGKTYSMLEAARRKCFDEHVDVVIGFALSHGRAETEKLLQGLETIPLLNVAYKGTTLRELNLDGIYQRAPELVIIDELAHTNPPNMRHMKRYIDVEELLDAGIDVYTTLNIQHLESYQDAIENAIGVKVRERIPDRILDEADEIELIDLPPEELLERLRQGKVYIPEQAERAIQQFFRIETLQLLREMALRKVAAIVDSDRSNIVPSNEKGQKKLQLEPRLLASIGPGPFSEQVIRVTKRLADMLKAPWYAVSVETPDNTYNEDPETKRRIGRLLELVEELGGRAFKIQGESISDALFQFSKDHQITQIVIGHSLRPWYQRLFSLSPVDQLISRDRSIDVYVISSANNMLVQSGNSNAKQSSETSLLWRARSFFLGAGDVQKKYCLDTIVYPLGIVFMLSMMLLPFSEYITIPQIATLYLLSSGIAATIFDIGGFYFYLIWSLAVLDILYISDMAKWLSHSEVIFFFMAVSCVGTIINRLTVKKKTLLKALGRQHSQLKQLYGVSQKLVKLTNVEEMVNMLSAHLEQLYGLYAIFVEPQDNSQFSLKTYGSLHRDSNCYELTENEKIAAKWALDHQEPAGVGTDTLPTSKAYWFPLAVSDRQIGAVALFSKSPQTISTRAALEHEKDNIEPYLHLLALSIDRAHATL